MFGVIKYELLMVLKSFHFLSEYDEGIEDIFKMYILRKAKTILPIIFQTKGRQEAHEFKVSLGYKGAPISKTKIKDSQLNNTPNRVSKTTVTAVSWDSSPKKILSIIIYGQMTSLKNSDTD